VAAGLLPSVAFNGLQPGMPWAFGHPAFRPNQPGPRLVRGPDRPDPQPRAQR